MSLIVDDLAEYLETAGLGTVGTTLFKYLRPSSPLALISLHPLPGIPPEQYGKREHPEVQIVCRAASQGAALRQAYGVMAVLHGVQHVHMGETDVLTCHTSMGPAPIDEEQVGGQRAFLVSMRFMFDLRRPSS